MQLFLPYYLGQYGHVITKHRLKRGKDKMRSFELKKYFVKKRPV